MSVNIQQASSIKPRMLRGVVAGWWRGEVASKNMICVEIALHPSWVLGVMVEEEHLSWVLVVLLPRQLEESEALI